MGEKRWVMGPRRSREDVGRGWPHGSFATERDELWWGNHEHIPVAKGTGDSGGVRVGRRSLTEEERCCGATQPEDAEGKRWRPTTGTTTRWLGDEDARRGVLGLFFASEGFNVTAGVALATYRRWGRCS